MASQSAYPNIWGVNMPKYEHDILYGIDTPSVPSETPGHVEHSNNHAIAAESVVEKEGNDTQTSHPQPRPSASYTQTHFIHKVRQIFNEHAIDGVSSTDHNAVFTSIADICQDLNDKRNQMQQYEHQYKHLVSHLQRENTKLKLKYNELEHQLFLSKVTNDNILQQVREYLSQLVDELTTYDTKSGEGQSACKHFRLKLAGMYESLTDLAQDLNTQELHNAVTTLKKGIDDIELLEHHGACKYEHLHNILNGLTTAFGEMPQFHHETPCGTDTNETKETESSAAEDNHTSDHHQKDEKHSDFDDNTATKHGAPKEECPRVIRIDIDGGWFNKKTRAIIKYRGKAFGRKEADFKWLYKMLQCDFKWLGKDELDTNDVVLPDFNKELPHTMWHDDYLMKRKRELNLFLMQCHSLKNIRSGTQYHIFLDHKKDQWKKK
eukprot:528376_1